MKLKVQEEALQAFGMLHRLAHGDIAKYDAPTFEGATLQLESVRTDGNPAILSMVKSARLFTLDYQNFANLMQPIYTELMTGVENAVIERCFGGREPSEDTKVGPEIHEALLDHQLEVYMDRIERYEWKPLVLPFDSIFIAFHNNDMQYDRVRAGYESLTNLQSDRFKPLYLVSTGLLMAPNFIYSLAFYMTNEGRQLAHWELSPMVEEGVLSILNSPSEVVNLLAAVELVKRLAGPGTVRLRRDSMEYCKHSSDF